MHPAVKEFVKETILNHWRDDYKTVMDFGSRDINGNVKNLLPPGTKYCGVDKIKGPNVNLVANTNDLKDYIQDYSVDVVICTETLEHDRNPRLTVMEAKRILKKGGLLIITCAGVGRPEHDKKLCGGYYRNISEEEMIAWTRDFEIPYAEITLDSRDLRFWGIK